MKKTASVYIPHYGCPNDCVFCNQVKISGRKTNLDYKAMELDILKSISTMREGDIVEIAFFGGSFTAIEDEVQDNCLELANEIGRRINKKIQIKLSTRPDKIDEKVIKRLKKYKVDTVELGVQSMDDEVLETSNRGHNSDIVYYASDIIKNSGIKLGLQIMIGLPKDTKEKLYSTIEKVIDIKPDIARIYPVLVIKDTELENMYYNKEYTPLDLQTTIKYAKYMYQKFEYAGINVIRIGLQATENITIGNDVVAGPFHSAFGELVINEIYKDKIEEELLKNKYTSDVLYIYSPKKYTSKILGNKKRNYDYFKNKYNIQIKIKNIDDDKIIILGEEFSWKDFLKTN